MQLECSDESLARSIGLQSTPSSVIRAAVEDREILSAANGFAPVEDEGDTCVITKWAASASDVCVGSASRLAHGEGQVQLRGQPLSFSGYARDPAFNRDLVHVFSGIERSRRKQSRRADRGAGIANT